MDGFTACFEGLDDPRTGNAGRHDLLEMLMIALCTVLSGGEDPTARAEALAKLAADASSGRVLVSTITLFDGVAIADFDGLPTSASRLL